MTKNEQVNAISLYSMALTNAPQHLGEKAKHESAARALELALSMAREGKPDLSVVSTLEYPRK